MPPIQEILPNHFDDYSSHNKPSDWVSSSPEMADEEGGKKKARWQKGKPTDSASANTNKEKMDSCCHLFASTFKDVCSSFGFCNSSRHATSRQLGSATLESPLASSTFGLSENTLVGSNSSFSLQTCHCKSSACCSLKPSIKLFKLQVPP
jgi:hypothetical protein